MILFKNNKKTCFLLVVMEVCIRHPSWLIIFSIAFEKNLVLKYFVLWEKKGFFVDVVLN